jgi:hypothetical protein
MQVESVTSESYSNRRVPTPVLETSEKRLLNRLFKRQKQLKWQYLAIGFSYFTALIAFLGSLIIDDLDSYSVALYMFLLSTVLLVQISRESKLTRIIEKLVIDVDLTMDDTR